MPGKTARKIRIGTIYPTTIGVLPAFLAKIARKYPDIQLLIQSGSTGDIIRNLECGQITSASSGRWRTLAACASSRWRTTSICWGRQGQPACHSRDRHRGSARPEVHLFLAPNLSYTERYFGEMFAEHDLARNIAYSCDDTFVLISLVSAGLGIGFAPQWTKFFPNRNFDPQGEGRGFRIGMGVAWNTEDPTAARDDIIDIARSLVRPQRELATALSR